MKLDPRILDAEILIVDDERANIQLLARILGSCGYRRIRGTEDPLAIVSLLRERGCDILILDLHMPRMDGFQVMRELDSLLERDDDYLPVLVLTGKQDPGIKRRALESGATDFLVKPFDHAEVASRVRNMLQVRLLHKRVRQQNAALENKARERAQELEETRLEIIRRLGLAAEFRDNETGLHLGWWWLSAGIVR